MKIIAWNVRGLGSPAKRAIIKNVLSSACPDVIILSETKLMNINKFLVKSLWSSISIDWVCLDAIGSSGGILIMWDALNINVTSSVCGHFSLCIHCNL